MKQKNPFVLVGYEGPDYFCDRVAETKALIRAIVNGSNVTLLAPRRYGKTGLISNVFHALAKKGKYETIYLDLFGTQNLADFTNALANAVLGRLDTPLEKAGGIAKRLIKSLRPTISYDTMSGNPSLSFDVSAKSPQNTLAQIFDYIKARGHEVVIALDEFQQIGEYPEKGVEATLRGYVQFSPARFIFVGSKQHIISAKGRRISKEVFHELYTRFDGITWYLQAMLWEFYADDADITDLDQLDAVVSRRVRACEYDQQRVMTILPAGARRLLRAIAAERKVKEPQSGSFVAKYGLRAASSVKTSLDMLVEKELVYPTPDGYVVYDRLMAEYLRCLGK